ncbi:MAG: transcriptional repressor [Rickettsiales bacterium]|nr:transcriptional repressor [Rickettsiales bacterium]
MTSSCHKQGHHHCINQAIKDAEEICESKGSRLTDLRRRVLELIWADHQSIKAYDLLSELKKEIPSAKPPTIYRALDFLLEHGLIHKIHSLNAYIGSTTPNMERPSFLLICTSCQKVTESDDAEYKELIENIPNAHNFLPQKMSLEIEGLCGDCS